MTHDFHVVHNGASLAAESRGDGEALVFLHAGVADRRMWRAQTVELASGWRTIAYDRRGFGETTCGDEPFSHVDDLAAVLEHCGDWEAALVGCSQGGRIAIDFALAHPEAVTSLVLIAPAISGAPDGDEAELPAPVREQIAALERAEAEGDIERVNAIEANLWLDGPGMPEQRVSGAARSLLLEMNAIALRHPELHHESPPPGAFERLGELAMPVMVVCGSLDFPHIQANCRHLVGTIPHARGVELEGVAHLPSLEQPKQLNDLLTEFLSGLQH